MSRHSPSADEPPPPPHSAAERTLTQKLTSAYVIANLDGLLALLAEDVRPVFEPFLLAASAKTRRGILRVHAWTTHLRTRLRRAVPFEAATWQNT
jgi:hypothetical protein